MITLKDLSDNPKWKYTKILRDEIEDIKAIIIIFSLNCKESFEHTKMLLDYFRIHINSSSNTPQLISTGNKNDLYRIFKSSIQIKIDEILQKKK